MLKRICWIIIGTIILVVIACIAGCAARTITAAVPTGTAVPTGPAAYTATIHNAPAGLVSLSVDGRPVPRCTDILKPPCFDQQGTSLTIRALAQGREREAGNVTVTMLDAGGRVTGTVVRITGWGRFSGAENLRGKNGNRGG